MAELCLWAICINVILPHIPAEALDELAPLWLRVCVVATVGVGTFICTYRYMSRKINTKPTGCEDKPCNKR